MFFSVKRTATVSLLSFSPPLLTTTRRFFPPPLVGETHRQSVSFTTTTTTTTMSSVSAGGVGGGHLEDWTQEQEQRKRQQQQHDFPRTFYRRKLPSTLISFSSPEGRRVFQSAVASGGVASFFSLIEQLCVLYFLVLIFFFV